MPTEGAKRPCSENPGKRKVQKTMSGANEKEKKPMVQSAHINLKFEAQVKIPLRPMDQSAHITLKVTDQCKKEVFLRVKRNAQLSKLMTAYCGHMSLDQYSVAFLFNERVLRKDHTPDQLEMIDGDEIEVTLHADGGSFGGLRG